MHIKKCSNQITLAVFLTLSITVCLCNCTSSVLILLFSHFTRLSVLTCSIGWTSVKGKLSRRGPSPYHRHCIVLWTNLIRCWRAKWYKSCYSNPKRVFLCIFNVMQLFLHTSYEDVWKYKRSKLQQCQWISACNLGIILKWLSHKLWFLLWVCVCMCVFGGGGTK